MKKVIYLFIINIMLMITSFVLMTIYQHNLNINRSGLLAAIMTLGFLLIIFVILLIFQVSINISKESDIKSNEKMITLTIVIIFGVIILLLISYSISQMLFAKRTELMISDANKINMVVKEKNIKNYVFTLSDIKNIKLNKSPFGNKYKKKSYVTTFNETNNICLTDGKYSIIRNDTTQELELVEKDVCDLIFEEKEASLFIQSKLLEKYNISFDVYNCKRNYDYDSVFNDKTGITCKIKYDGEESYRAILYDKSLELIDSYR